MKNKFGSCLAFSLLVLVCTIHLTAQKNASKDRGIIFAVINDGSTLEPLAFGEARRL